MSFDLKQKLSEAERHVGNIASILQAVDSSLSLTVPDADEKAQEMFAEAYGPGWAADSLAVAYILGSYRGMTERDQAEFIKNRSNATLVDLASSVGCLDAVLRCVQKAGVLI
ncbi:MAG: hypothetical protein KGL39_04110 [Patescibacteria group bacterium]|nr:hypothetical protein [Patescibacteria group bacterium]